MERHVFGYRASGRTALGMILLAWGIVWLIMIARSWETAVVLTNGGTWVKPVSHAFLFGLSAACSVVVVTGLLMAAGGYNRRVEIAGRRIRFFDSFGGRVLDGSLASARFTSPPMSTSCSWATIRTDAGEFKVSKALGGFAKLALLILTGDVCPPKSPKDPGYIPPPRTFTYRVSWLQLIALVFLAAVGFANSGWVAMHDQTGMTLMASAFLLIPVVAWSQAVAWNEQISITVLGIRWQDMFGRTLVTARFDEILGVAEVGSVEALRSVDIYTTHGTIRASVLLPNRHLLIAEIRRLLASRGTLDLPNADWLPRYSDEALFGIERESVGPR